MKIYTKALINAIQTIINSGNIELTTYKEYTDFFNVIQSLNIRLERRDDISTGRRDVWTILNDPDITTEFFKDWKTTAVGKFFVKDYKKDIKDFLGNTLYHKLTLTIDNKKVIILVRLLNEITNNELPEIEKNELIENYGDITIDGKYFSIIKITNVTNCETWAGWDMYKSKDIFTTSNNSLEMSNSYIEEVSDEDNDKNSDNMMMSEPLF